MAGKSVRQAVVEHLGLERDEVDPDEFAEAVNQSIGEALRVSEGEGYAVSHFVDFPNGILEVSVRMLPFRSLRIEGEAGK